FHYTTLFRSNPKVSSGFIKNAPFIRCGLAFNSRNIISPLLAREVTSNKSSFILLHAPRCVISAISFVTFGSKTEPLTIFSSSFNCRPITPKVLCPTDIIDEDRREQIREGTFDWTEIENVVPSED